MTSARFRFVRRPGLLTAAALSLGLTGVLTQQLLPTAASAEQPRVQAAAAQDPTVVDPSPAPVTVVVPEDVPDELLVDAAPTAAPVPVSVPKAAPKPKPVAKPVTPAKPRPAPKKKAAPAAGDDICSGPGWQQRRGARALASLRYPTPSGVSVSFLAGRSGYLGLTYPARRHVDMFVRSCSAESSSLLRHVMAHEMGHAYDAAHMTGASRAAYMAARGIPAGTPWFGCAYCTDFATPAGDFAETYAQWQRGASDNRSQLAPAASAAALARLGATFFSR